MKVDEQILESVVSEVRADAASCPDTRLEQEYKDLSDSILSSKVYRSVSSRILACCLDAEMADDNRVVVTRCNVVVTVNQHFQLGFLVGKRQALAEQAMLDKIFEGSKGSKER